MYLSLIENLKMTLQYFLSCDIQGVFFKLLSTFVSDNEWQNWKNICSLACHHTADRLSGLEWKWLFRSCFSCIWYIPSDCADSWFEFISRLFTELLLCLHVHYRISKEKDTWSYLCDSRDIPGSIGLLT